jgi:mannose-6-phosphate isomerase-like protein (cupin superfamily)
MPFSPPEFQDVFLSRMLLDGDNSGSDRLQVNHCVLKPGCGLPGAVHRPPYDEIYYVLSGEAVLRMDDEDHDLGKDTLVFIPGGTFHALTNNSQLGGGTASLSPLRRSPQFHRGSLPALLGRGMNPRPATKGAYPLGTPD